MYKDLPWILLAGSVIALMVVAIISMEIERNTQHECGYYSDWELRTVPARCVSYFITGTEYAFSTTTNRQ